jgi:hypothetical protein
MTISKKYHGFISHCWEANEEYKKLETMLKSFPGFDWECCSSVVHNPDANEAELENEIRKQIGAADHVIVLTGIYDACTKWVDQQIEIAKAMGKPIIGVKPIGCSGINEKLQTSVTEFVGMFAFSIVEVIRDNVT